MGTLFCEDVSMMEKWSLLSVVKVGIGLFAPPIPEFSCGRFGCLRSNQVGSIHVPALSEPPPNVGAA